MNRIIRNTGFYLLIFLVTVGIVQFISNQNDTTQELRYDQLRQEIANNNVAELTLKFDGMSYLVTGEYRKAPSGAENKEFFSRMSAEEFAVQEVVEASEANDFDLTMKKMQGPSIWLTFLTSIIPFVIIFILFFFLINQAQGGGGKVMNFGKSRARLYNEEKKRVTFEDVAGADEEKQELVEVVEFLKDPRKFAAVGARIPKGVLLVEMDGFGANEGIIIVAATNRPDILDPALLRPGRFDRQITVDRPDVKGREAVLKVHARNKPLAKDVKLEVIAKRTTGFTGADLENLLNEAALLAARRNKKDIAMIEVDEAIDRVVVGTEKRSRVISDREKRIVAYHEAGHTIIGYFLEHADAVHKVTIIPRGRAGGYVIMLPKEDRMLVTKQELLDKVTGLLGGRVAEELFIGEIGTGAYSDFKQATSIVRSMIMEYGMSEKLGPLQFGNTQGQVFLGRDIGHEQNYSDAIAYEIDQELQNIINYCYNRAKDLLNEKNREVHLIAQTLLKEETLELEQIKRLIDTGSIDGEGGGDGTPAETTGEPSIDTLGNVRVRIQSKEPGEGTLPPGDNNGGNGSTNG